MSVGGQMLISASQLRQLVTTKLQFTECVSPSCRQKTAAIGVLVSYLQEFYSINDTQGRMLEELIQRLNGLYQAAGQTTRFNPHTHMRTANSRIAQELMAKMVKMNLISAEKIWRNTPATAAQQPSTSNVPSTASPLHNGVGRRAGCEANSRRQNVGCPPRMANGPPPTAGGTTAQVNGATPAANASGTATAATPAGRSLPVNEALLASCLRALSDSTKSKDGQPVDGATGTAISLAAGREGDPIAALTAMNGAAMALNGSNKKRPSEGGSPAAGLATKRFCPPPTAVLSAGGGATALIAAGPPLLVNGKSPAVVGPNGRLAGGSSTLVLHQTSVGRLSASPTVSVNGSVAGPTANVHSSVFSPTNEPPAVCGADGLSKATNVLTSKSASGTLNGSSGHLAAKKPSTLEKTKSLSANGDAAIQLNGLKESATSPKKTVSPTAAIDLKTTAANGKPSAVSSSCVPHVRPPALLLSPLAGKDGRYWSITGERVTLRPPSFSSHMLNMSIDAKAAPCLNRVVITSDETGKVECKLNYEVKSPQQKLYIYYHLGSPVGDPWRLGQVFDGKPDGFMQMTMQFKDAKPQELLWVTFRTVRADPLAISDLIRPIVLPLNVGAHRRILRLHWDDKSGEYRRRLKANSAAGTNAGSGPVKGPSPRSAANAKVAESTTPAAKKSFEIIQLD